MPSGLICTVGLCELKKKTYLAFQDREERLKWLSQYLSLPNMINSCTAEDPLEFIGLGFYEPFLALQVLGSCLLTSKCHVKPLQTRVSWKLGCIHEMDILSSVLIPERNAGIWTQDKWAAVAKDEVTVCLGVIIVIKLIKILFGTWLDTRASVT